MSNLSYKPQTNLGLTGLDIQGEPDENDRRSLAEVEAFARSDRYVTPTQETTEYAQYLHEAHTRRVSDYRWENQEELAVERPGKILHENEFLAMLQRCCTAKVNDWSRYGLRGLSVWKDNRWQYVCAIQAGYMHEWSEMYFNEYRLPTSEKFRGWRTVLLRLIMQDFVSEERAHTVFGAAPIEENSRRYRHQLWMYRNRPRKENGDA